MTTTTGASSPVTSSWVRATAATKILIDQATDRVVGAHLLGPGYAELVNIFGLTALTEIPHFRSPKFPTLGRSVA
ncbi:hypothetical protein [Agromyces sp. Soil535]|uniref:hypothetical protein n=1 Tax=Agromyces sp. Soil535 TaxID=1736390 RepID=UPI0009EBAC5D|nr:hypothetical protein [Agromyces sp. Soil535]